MPRKTTPSFILELALDSSLHDEAELNARFEAARQLYNACLDEAKRRLELLRQSKDFQEARKMPKTVNGKANKERTEAFKKLKRTFSFSEYDLHAYATKIRNSWIGNHIDASTSQKIATRAFKAVQRIAFGQAKKVRFKGKNQLKSVEGKSNATGIRYVVCVGLIKAISSRSINEHKAHKKEKTGEILWNGLKLKCIIDVNDEVVVHGLSCPVKYCRLVKRIFNDKTRFFAQLVLKGKPFVKEKNESSDNIVGLDIGPSTIAFVSDKQANLEHFCPVLSLRRITKDQLSLKQKEIRRLQRKLDRQRRANNLRLPCAQLCGFESHLIASEASQRRLDEYNANKNPQNYNSDGTIKKGFGTQATRPNGKKTWYDSKRYLKTKTKLAELQRKLAVHRKMLHGNLANRILKQGKYIKTEKLSYRAFQRNYGRSVRDRAPGMFMEILRRSFVPCAHQALCLVLINALSN